MKLNMIFALFLICTLGVSGQTFGDKFFNTPSGSYTIDNGGQYDSFEFVIETGTPYELNVTITFNTSASTGYIHVYKNYPSDYYAVTSLTGVGTHSYVTNSNASGQQVLIYASIDDVNDPDQYFYATVEWDVIIPTNEFPANGQVKIQNPQTVSNLIVRDSYSKSMGATDIFTSNFSNAVISVENTNSKLGLSPSKISSNSPYGFGISSYGDLCTTSNNWTRFKAAGFNFSSPTTSGLLTVNNNGVGMGLTNYGKGSVEIGKSSGNWLVLRESTLSTSNFWSVNNVSSVDQCLFQFNNGSTGAIVPIMSFLNDGKVTIGTTTSVSDAALTVKGKITADEVKVQLVASNELEVTGNIYAGNIRVNTNGQTADFVFSEDYLLKDLSQVESYIKEHGHLPEIPSAKEMEESGVDLVKMNKLLLQKIEELTLYTIEQDKKLKEFEKLKADIELIKASLSK